MTTVSAGLAVSVYRNLLYLLPSEFRRRNGAELAAMFGDSLRQARSAGLSSFRTWSNAIGDLLLLAVTYRWRRFFERRRQRSHPQAELKFPDSKKEPPMFKALVRDVSAAVRTLRRAPGFAIVPVLTIGLGLGATTLVFSVVHAVLLRPLPYEDADRLVNV